MRVLEPPLVFYSKTQNYTVVPKRSFVFLQRNTNFYSCTYTVYRFFIAKGNIQQLYLTAIHFSQLNTKFRVVLIRSLTMKYKNFKVVPNCLFAF